MGGKGCKEDERRMKNKVRYFSGIHLENMNRIKNDLLNRKRGEKRKKKKEKKRKEKG